MSKDISHFYCLPEELRKIPQWVLWKLIQVPGKKPTKIPYQVNGNKASTTNSSTLNTFESVCQAHETGSYSGIGFVFTEHDPYCGIDFDHVTDEHGNVIPIIAEWINKFASYTEWSQSKTGLHIVCKGKVDGCNKKAFPGIPGADCERYDNARYFVCTGDIYPGVPNTINNAQLAIDELGEFVEEATQTRLITAHNVKTTTNTLDDQTILTKASKAANGLKFQTLMQGDASGYPSQSEAELALCSILAFWTQDSSQIDRIFRGSGLYRPKWDQKHRSDGATYSQITIENAISSNRDQSSRRSLHNNDLSADCLAKTPAELMALTNNAADLVNKCSDIDFIIEPIFARRFVSLIFGEAGVGKTWLVLDLALCIANGYDVWGKHSVTPKKVLFLEGDAPDQLIKNRLNVLDKKSINPRNLIFANRHNYERNDIDLSISTKNGKRHLELLIEQHRADFVIIDTLISFFEGDESNVSDVRPVISYLRMLAEKYNCHILVCHHSRKRISNEKRTKLDQSDMIGSSGLNRLACCVLAVYKAHDDNNEPKEDTAIVECVKNWFETPKKFEFMILGDDNGRIKLEYNHDVFETDSKRDFVKRFVTQQLQDNPQSEIKVQHLIDSTGVSRDTVKRALYSLEEDKIIRGTGETKNRRYIAFLDTVICQPSRLQTPMPQEIDSADASAPNQNWCTESNTNDLDDHQSFGAPPSAKSNSMISTQSDDLADKIQCLENIF